MVHVISIAEHLRPRAIGVPNHTTTPLYFITINVYYYQKKRLSHQISLEKRNIKFDRPLSFVLRTIEILAEDRKQYGPPNASLRCAASALCLI